jgi:hypothetical protein
MKYEIKNFQTQDNQKLVGFWVINDNNQRLAIDKTVPIVEGKTNEQYASKPALNLLFAIQIGFNELWNVEPNQSALRLLTELSAKLLPFLA